MSTPPYESPSSFDEPNPASPTPTGVLNRVLNIAGTYNNVADQRIVDPILEAYPGMRDVALDDFQFTERVTRYMIGQGITQFLVLAYSLPLYNQVHHVAQALTPKARVVYVTSDPLVNLQTSAMIVGRPRVGYVDADLRTPDVILNDPTIRELIDFTRPVGVLIVGSLNYIADRDDPYGAVQHLLEEVPSGSYVAISNVTADGIDPGLFDMIESAYADVPNRFYFRTRQQITRFYGDWEILEPGIVHAGDWTVEGDAPTGFRPMTLWAGVARKP